MNTLPNREFAVIMVERAPFLMNAREGYRLWHGKCKEFQTLTSVAWRLKNELITRTECWSRQQSVVKDAKCRNCPTAQASSNSALHPVKYLQTPAPLNPRKLHLFPSNFPKFYFKFTFPRSPQSSFFDSTSHFSLQKISKRQFFCLRE